MVGVSTTRMCYNSSWVSMSLMLKLEHILMMDQMPSISKVFGLVVQKERQRTINQSFSSPMVLFLVSQMLLSLL